MIPQCRRCHRDGLGCPGYATRQSTWTITTPSNIHTTVLSARSKSRFEATTPFDFSGPVLPARWEPLLPLLNLAPSISMPENVMFHQFTETLAYWSAEIRPTFLGCPVPGQPRAISWEEWTVLPRIMQHCVASVVSCHQTARGYEAKNIATRLHAHTGRALAMLRQFLLEWEQVPGWSVLVLVTTMMVIEVMTHAGGSKSAWHVHLEAAWKFVAMQGESKQKQVDGTVRKSYGPAEKELKGLERSWKESLETSMSCAYLMQGEVFSSTTCPDNTLRRRPGLIKALDDNVLDGLQDRFLLTPCPCPLPITKAIAEVNDVRISLYTLSTTEGFDVPHSDLPEDPPQRIWSILTTLLCFDTATWVAQMAARFRPDLPSPEFNAASFSSPSTTIPSTTPTPRSSTSTTPTPAEITSHPFNRAWTALANAYRSAALIYFLRAMLTSPHLRRHFPDAHRDLAATSPSLLAAHRATLEQELTFLTPRCFLVASSAAIAVGEAETEAGGSEEGEDGGVTARRLGRFLAWPLFVDAYEAIAWGGPRGKGSNREVDVMIEEKVRRLETLGRLFGVGCMADAAAFLQGFKTRIRASDVADTWRWEEGFDGRWIFSV